MTKKDINISIIGTGRMGYYHARLLSRLGYLDSIVDINPKIAKVIGTQFDVPWYSDLNEMIKERNPNGVIVAVPTSIHSQIALEVIKNAPRLKAMIIEKPLASNVKEAVDLKLRIDNAQVKVIIGHVEVFNPVIAKIQEIIASGLVGNLRSILFQRRGAIAETRLESIGDVFVDLGVHDFDIISRLLPTKKVKLFATAVKSNGIINSSTVVIFPEGEQFYFTLLMSREYAGKLRTIDIEGTKATLSANLISQIVEIRSLEIARGEKDSIVRIPFSSGEQLKLYGEPLLLEIWNLVDCIKGKSIPIVSLDDGIKALKLVEAARKSTKDEIVIHLHI